MRPVEQYAARRGMIGQNGRQHVAGSPADINNRLEGGKIVGRGDRPRLMPIEADHRLTEQRRVFWILREVVEGHGAVREHGQPTVSHSNAHTLLSETLVSSLR